MNGQGKYEWQRRQRFEIVGGMPSSGDTGRPRMNQKALRRHLASQGNQPRPGVTATVAILDWEKFMSNEEKIISLLEEIRDLLRGGGGAYQPIQAAHGPTQSFTAELLAATVDKGKTYWKVQGGVFSKFGVTVWPEVLAAAGFGDLNPMQTYDLTGYTAVYVLNEEGKAQKVIQLIPPTAVPSPEPPPAPQTAAPPSKNGRTPKANGKPAAVAESPAEPAWFRPGDKVQATDLHGRTHEGVITGTVGSDNKIAVKIGEKIYRLELEKVEMLEPAF